MTEHSDLAVVIPALNADKTLGPVVEGAVSFLPVLVVDDGSTDRTAEVAESNGARVVKHEVNLGKGEALRTGFHYWRTHGVEAVITLDADAQHDPEEIPRFVEAFREHDWDLILGLREGEKIPWARRLPNQLCAFFLRLISGVDLPDSQAGFRLYRLSSIEPLGLRCSRFDYEIEIIVALARAGARIGTVPISTIYDERPFAVSHYRPFLDSFRITALVARYMFLNPRPRQLT